MWSLGIIFFIGEWAWLAIAIFMALPVILIFLFTERAALFFADHLFTIGIVYFSVALILALVLYFTQKKRWKPLIFPAVLLTVLPMFLALTLYLAPFEIMEPGIDPIIDFFIIMLLYLGGAALVTALSTVCENSFWYLVMAGIYFILCMLFLRLAISTERDIITEDNIRAIYGLR